MRKVNLCDFIHQIVDDEYALNIVYYSIKRMIVQREFDMGGITRFSIDERFLGEKTEVICRIRITSNAIWFSFLLSLRILMLDKDKIKFCSDDYLIFKPFPDQQFQWIKLLSFIVSHSQDNEVRMLYQLLGSAYDQQMPTDDMMDKFAKSMEMPEYKHLRKYYKNLSARTKGVNVPVVGDNAFLEADFEEYTLDKEIEYVGNTAFAFCKKLKTLRLQDKVRLELFPSWNVRNSNKLLYLKFLWTITKRLCHFTRLSSSEKSMRGKQKKECQEMTGTRKVKPKTSRP